MAGIGFTLKKLFERGDFTSLAKVSLAGVFIVAGPWLISILTMALLEAFLLRGSPAGPLLTASLVYSYAGSLVLFGGFHYLITRVIADKIYLKQERRAAASLLTWTLFMVLLSALVALPGAFFLLPEGPQAPLLRPALVFLFVSINLVFCLMIFASLLKWYLSLLVIYALGMAALVAGVGLLAPVFGPGGAVMGAALGHFIIAVTLGLFVFKSYPPDYREYSWKSDASYLPKFWMLFLTGIFYNAALWADKALYWSLWGTPVPGTAFTLFDAYDGAVFLANLSLIPGLVYFVAVLETTYFVELQRFTRVLLKESYGRIQRARVGLNKLTFRQLRLQSLFQAGVTVLLVLGAGTLAERILGRPESFSNLVWALLAAWPQLLFFSLINLLFYMEQYKKTLWLSLVYTGTSLAFSLPVYVLNWPAHAGSGFFWGGILTSVIAWREFQKVLRRADHLMFSQ